MSTDPNNGVVACSLLSFAGILCLFFLFVPLLLTGLSLEKQCVLTITRPNGHTRSYKSEAVFKKKSDARNSVADTAVEMGAIDFIVHGNKSSNRMLVPVHEEYKKHLAEHVKLLECSTLVKDGQPAEVKVDEMSRQILEHCVEWRAGKVTPRWIFYTDPKTRREFPVINDVSVPLNRY